MKKFKGNIKKLQSVRNDLTIRFDRNKQIILCKENSDLLDQAISKINEALNFLDKIE
jgi:hypothetical protein